MYVLVVKSSLSIEYCVVVNDADVAVMSERIEKALGPSAREYKIVPFNATTIADIEADAEFASEP